MKHNYNKTNTNSLTLKNHYVAKRNFCKLVWVYKGREYWKKITCALDKYHDSKYCLKICRQ